MEENVKLEGEKINNNILKSAVIITEIKTEIKL